MFALQLFHEFKIALAVLAPGADEVVRHFVALVDVATDFADPAFLATLSRRDACAPGGFDVLLVVAVGDAGRSGELPRLGYLGDEHRVGAQVEGLHHAAGDDRVDELGQIQQAVLRAQLLLAVGELVHIATTLEAKMLEGLHGGLLAQRTEVEHLGVQHHVMREVLLVDTEHELQRLVGYLLRHVDDAAVVPLTLAGNEDVEAVADAEDGLFVYHGAWFRV